MASLGRMTNSIVSAVNENSLSLANLNFDFSLVTVQVPPEYSQVGSSLAVRKRDNAENGTAHRTARKLGALFESIIPHTPLLVSAYGTRASQIIATPGLNPKGSTQHHGPFVDWVGADATSIWAAATSGSHCIAVHLLACMLARAFEDPAVSTSLWAQLIEQRQKEIEEMSKTNFTSAQFATINAASQQFLRQELREWDASVRAWLLSADAAMILEHNQLQLIIKNTSISVNGGGPSAYADVMNTWKHAMTGLESLLAGEPQCVTNGGILLAISSWHLYPTLMVLGSQVKMVTIKDPLVPKAGVITIGIEKAASTQGSSTVDRECDGIYWSIALSHYRYYGLPVEVVGKSTERLHIDQLHLVALGSLFGSWDVSRQNPLPACRWMVTLWECINKVSFLSTRSSWLRHLAEAASCVLQSKEKDTPGTRHWRSLFDFGHRRHKTFLGVKTGDKTGSVSSNCLPWFGLRSSHLLDALSCESPAESAISYLRALASYGRIGPNKALITWISKSSGPKGSGNPWDTHIYMSAVPSYTVNRNSYPAFDDWLPSSPEDVPELVDNNTPWEKGKKISKGKETSWPEGGMFRHSSRKHDYWIGNFDQNGKHRENLPASLNDSPSQWRSLTSNDEEMAYTNTPQGYISLFEPNNGILGTPSGQQTGSAATVMRNHQIDPFLPMYTDQVPLWMSRNLSDGFHDIRKPLNCGHRFAKRQSNSITVACEAFIPSGGLEHFTSDRISFDTRLNTDQEYFHLLFTNLPGSEKQEFEDRVLRLRQCTEDLLALEESIKQLEMIKSPHLLWQYFEGPDPYEPDTFIKAFLSLISHERSTCQATLLPLRNLAFATTVYETLDGATISTRIVDTGLANAKWAVEESCPSPMISHILSCIAMMETGVVNLDLGAMTNVLGLCSGNSMFVLSRLLTDPSARLKHQVTRLVGNVGRPGVSLLVPPSAGPLVRPLSSSYCAVSYAPFDGKWEDNFGETTLHLSFTKHEFPIDYGVSGIMDHQVFLVESVISVHDRAKWVADLDILTALKPDAMPLLPRIRKPDKSKCFHNDRIIAEAADNLTSLDTWEEILDAPPGIGIVRAHKNWAARLTVGAVLSHKQKLLMIEEHGLEKDEGLRSEQALQGQRRIFAILEEVDHVCHVCVYQRVKQWRRKYAKDDSPLYLVA